MLAAMIAVMVRLMMVVHNGCPCPLLGMHVGEEHASVRDEQVAPWCNLLCEF